MGFKYFAAIVGVLFILFIYDFGTTGWNSAYVLHE